LGRGDQSGHLRALGAPGWAVRVQLGHYHPSWLGIEGPVEFYPGYTLSDGRHYRLTLEGDKVRRFESKDEAELVAFEIVMLKLNMFDSFRVSVVRYGEDL
jgi:hypothetical protein